MIVNSQANLASLIYSTYPRTWLRLLSVVIITGLICQSCDDESANLDTINSTNDEFAIDIFQNLEAPKSELILQIYTFYEFDCDNYLITNTKECSESEINIFLNDIAIPEACEVLAGPAIANIPIDISTNGTREINIIFIDEVFDSGTLVNTTDNVSLNFRTDQGIKSFVSDLRKIPNNSLLALFQYQTDTQQELITQIISALESMELTLVLEDGYYGHFSVDAGSINSKNDTVESTGIALNTSSLTTEELRVLLESIDELYEGLEDEGILLTLIETAS